MGQKGRALPYMFYCICLEGCDWISRHLARRFARRFANALLPPHLYKSGGRSEAEVII